MIHSLQGVELSKLITTENVKKLMDNGLILWDKLEGLEELTLDALTLNSVVIEIKLLVSKELVSTEKYLFMLEDGKFVQLEDQLKLITEPLFVQKI